MTDLLDQTPDNPRAVIGGNEPPAPGSIEELKARLEIDHRDKFAKALAALDDCNDLPKGEIGLEDVETLSLYREVMVRVRAIRDLLISTHKVEKEPHWSKGVAIDGHFFAMIDRLGRRDKKANPGALDRLQAKIDDWAQRKEAEETRLRLAEAERLRKQAQELREKQEAEEKAAAEAAAAAERARKPENIAAHEERAEEHATNAAIADARGNIAEDQLFVAQTHAAAPVADKVRTRLDPVGAGGFGGMVGGKKVPYSIVVDRDKLDKEKLWPFIKDEAIAQALEAWAKTTGHKGEMAGAEIGHRAKGTVR